MLLGLRHRRRRTAHPVQGPATATAPLPEQTLDGDTLRLPLAERFGAAPGEVFTYVAQSSDPSVASVLVEAGVLVVEAEGDGVGTVTVTATDAYGQTGTLTFTVRATLPMRGAHGERERHAADARRPARLASDLGRGTAWCLSRLAAVAVCQPMVGHVLLE